METTTSHKPTAGQLRREATIAAYLADVHKRDESKLLESQKRAEELKERFRLINKRCDALGLEDVRISRPIGTLDAMEEIELTFILETMQEYLIERNMADLEIALDQLEAKPLLLGELLMRGEFPFNLGCAGCFVFHCKSYRDYLADEDAKPAAAPAKPTGLWGYIHRLLS